MNKNTSKKTSYIFTNILLIIFIIIFLIAGWNIYLILSDYKKGTDIYEELIELAVVAPQTTPVDSDTSDDISTPLMDYSYFQINFPSLQAVNEDIIAWIRFDAPDIINYPVLQGIDNDEYLHTNIYGEYNSSGCLFIEQNNANDFSDDNTIIYGHNMRNNSMFGDLSQYAKKDFYKEHPYFYIYTPDNMAAKYQVVAVTEVMANDGERYTLNFGTKDSFQSYIYTMLRTSYYDTEAPVSTDSSLVTLSTCTALDDKRFIVQGVKIEEKPAQSLPQ